MTEYASGDWHLGNVNIIKYTARPFDTVDEMNETIIDNINKVCQPDDTLYVLGDAVMGQIAETLPLVSLINCKTILVPGNHDRVHPCYYPKPRPDKIETWTEKYLEHFDEIAPLEIEVDGFRMCHFPHTGDHTGEVRYPEWRPVDDSLPLIHGHVHDEWKVNGNMVNVGVDVWDYKPVSIELVKLALAVSRC